MARTSSNLTEIGTTSIPKALRVRLGLTGGARLRWELVGEDELRVVVVHRYGATPDALATQEPSPPSSLGDRD